MRERKQYEKKGKEITNAFVIEACAGHMQLENTYVLISEAHVSFFFLSYIQLSSTTGTI